MKLLIIFNNFFKIYEHLFVLPTQYKELKTGWLAYPLIIKDTKNIKRADLQIYLEKNNIQTRTIFTGNILRQPIMKSMIYKKTIDSYVNSNNVMKNGLLIGCHHGLTPKDIKFMLKKFLNFFKFKKLI